MTTNSVLAALAVRFTLQYENVATEALMHVLRTHAPSSAAVAALLGHSGLPDLPRLAFRTQAYGPDGSIPDLVGTDVNSAERLIVEVKFWAELTEHQPITYLSRLSDTLPSVLLFVCPAKRVPSLWDTLKCRIGPTIAESDNQGELPQAVTWSQVPPMGHLAILSWHALLSTLLSDAASHGDQLYEGNVQQLEGLCERVDSEAFLPIHASELSAQIGRRVSQFAELTEVAVPEKMKARITQYGKPRSGGSAGRFFLDGDIGCLLEYSPMLWGRYEVSPLWLMVQDGRRGPKDWRPLPGAADTLRQVAANMPARVIEHAVG